MVAKEKLIKIERHQYKLMWLKPCWWMKLWFYNLGGKQLMSMKWSQLNKGENWKKNWKWLQYYFDQEINWFSGVFLGHNFFLSFFFWLDFTACGILVPQPGIEPMPPAMGVWSPNHWTTQELSGTQFLENFFNTGLIWSKCLYYKISSGSKFL